MSACVNWTGAKDQKGYGMKRVRGRTHRAHRLAYEEAHGPIPEGLVIDHLCRNTSCVNPDHLEAVTNRENILRGVGASARNAVKTHCPAGHEYTADNTYTNPRGSRVCRECKRAKGRVEARQRRARVAA